MTRVNENREAQRAQEQRRAEQQDRSRRSDSDAFKRMVASKQENTARANAANEKAANGKAAANKMLLARQGIQANRFSSMLQNQGKHDLQNGQLDTKSRTDQMKDTEKAHNEKDAKLEKRKLDAEGDKLAAIGRDDREGGGGGGSDLSGGGDSQMSKQQEQTPNQLSGSNIAGQAAQIAPAQAQEVQQSHAPQLPPQAIQEIVNRVMVGVNPEGLSEFHIDFKQDVLGGAHLQISAKDGKITAKFDTGDVNAARLLKASEGELARAFGHRGMSLERLEVNSR